MAYGDFTAIVTANLTGYDALHLHVKADIITYEFVVKITYNSTAAYYTFTLPDTTSAHHVMIDFAAIKDETLTSSVISIGINGPPTPMVDITLTFTNLYAVKGPLRVVGRYQSGTGSSATENTFYIHPTAITNLMMIPEKKSVPSAVQGQTIQAELKTRGQGQIKVTGGLIEYDAKEG